ncbi:MAG: ABC transporter ATP-binding protein [Methanomassiliicoccales archaeon]|nr:ABC transporter ATP-binding protein [Methanomassiliicoccales archaeon]NYT15264.1 ABC transporter ATP-binding protein [Methanomassiliicoccales archaeon]
MLEIGGVSKVFHDRRKGRGVIALRDIHLSVARNEFLVIIGPSGCGKSTLINMIAGFDRPTRGRILHEGEVVTGPSPRRAVVFQDHSLFPWMSVMENIEFGLVSNGISPSVRRKTALHYLELVGLSDFKDARPCELSGGMMQKVAVARTLALEPDLLLMDEPFGSLDEETRRRMDRELLSIWKKEKKTVIFITHNLEEAVLLADRIVLMSTRPGEVEAEWIVRRERPRDPMSPCMCELKREISARLTGVYHPENGEQNHGQIPVEIETECSSLRDKLAEHSIEKLKMRR